MKNAIQGFCHNKTKPPILALPTPISLAGREVGWIGKGGER
ncbi:hypothetical protein [Bathymodiolus platifrons methanotrophic gill symbiont]|nr:hypothetical protein [Bathymodiolus platifrons methanotrophic gill symbiont]